MTNRRCGWTVAIESFRWKGGLLHGWGTLHGCGEIPCAAWLEDSASPPGGPRGIRATLAKANRLAQQDEASIDFVLYGSLADLGQRSTSLCLRLEWQDGQQQRLQLPPPRHAPAGRGIARIVALPWKHYFSRGWRLVREGQTGLLLRKFSGMAHATITSGWHPTRFLKWATADGKPLALVIDHDLGGGANLYRQALVAQLAADGFTPLLLSAHHGILSYQVTAQRGARTRTTNFDDLDSLFGLLSQEPIDRVVFNNILSFPEPLILVRRLSAWLQEKKPAQFLFLVHDYYCICPVWLLLDHTGNYCGIPDAVVCSDCLRSNTAPFLEFADGADIATWRSVWGLLLNCASEIRCFSEASRKLLVRAYPHLDSNRVSVLPHQMEHARLRPVKLADPGWPVIGVIGHLAYHKGGRLVQDLADHILRTGGDARIVVVGTIDYPLPASVATVTGTYRPEQLPEILEKHRVNIGLFPSICPETFSYVAEEMMMMELPVVAFDIGAPGERVARYWRGLVLPLSPAEFILDHIYNQYLKHVVQATPITTCRTGN